MTAFLVGLALAVTIATALMFLICKVITAPRELTTDGEMARNMDVLRCPRCHRVSGKGGHVCDPLPPPPPPIPLQATYQRSAR